ncbi:hypothetical protein FBD73_05700 [Lacticaseibacillus paracasei]|uniref:hypothetical protein n=1 Tax=Lacticaseibacillus paracasei TaxID=1597 RepID=UPI001570DBCB|nr:hypothetical protein [Lacticaseibacillus paracasei]QKK92576.1 hypothetical protein FBD73_05700 [Lacticaseibacillus paracasei]
MSKSSLWVRQHHLVLALSLLLGSVVFLAIGLWATILLLLTVQPTVSLILVLLGGWLVLGGIAASAITLWQIICSSQQVTRGVRRLQWLLGGITIIIAAISYLWAESGDAPGLIFIGLFVAAMPFACWVLVSVWQLTLKQQA